MTSRGPEAHPAYCKPSWDRTLRGSLGAARRSSLSRGLSRFTGFCLRNPNTNKMQHQPPQVPLRLGNLPPYRASVAGAGREQRPALNRFLVVSAFGSVLGAPVASWGPRLPGPWAAKAFTPRGGPQPSPSPVPATAPEGCPGASVGIVPGPPVLSSVCWPRTRGQPCCSSFTRA